MGGEFTDHRLGRCPRVAEGGKEGLDLGGRRGEQQPTRGLGIRREQAVRVGHPRIPAGLGQRVQVALRPAGHHARFREAASPPEEGKTRDIDPRPDTAFPHDVPEVPEETAGPYPADGSNGVNVLTESGVVRSDITRSFGTGSAVAEGVPLTIAMTILDVQAGGTPVAGAAVYAWHCDREGRYSLYDAALASGTALPALDSTML